ncbi:MAG: hypothetical protein Q9167_006092 [Letrouitia subvulpina]
MPSIKRRRGQSLHLELPNSRSEELPQVAALFLIVFDVKTGYFVHNDDYAGLSAFVNNPAAESERNALMLAVGALLPLSYGRLGKSWKHAEGLKELAKSLANDHTNTEPLRQFWEEHQHHEDDEVSGLESPGASPSALKNRRREGKQSPDGQPQTRNRAASTGSALALPRQMLTPHHPALSLSTYLDTFGPLIFPLYKAALLRKRILLVCQAPVELVCKFGKLPTKFTLLSLPSAVHSFLPLSPLPTRIRPLFSVGVHDMSTLKTGSRTSHPHEPLASEGLGYGWVACTTDDILTIKDNLYDTLVTIPPAYSKDATQKVWPRIQGKRAINVKATQRDARRYQTLRRDLRRLFPNSHPSAVRKEPTPNFTPAYPVPGEVTKDDDSNDGGEDVEGDTQPLLPFPHLENDVETFDDASSTTDDRLLEPQSWSALAYDSFMWWASAGERRADMEEEADFDSSLLANVDINNNGGGSSSRSPGRPRSTTSTSAAKQLSSPGRQRQRRRSSTMMMEGGDDEEGGGGSGRVGGLEMQLIGYFHHLTALIVQTLAKVVDESTGSGGGGGGEEEEERGSERDGDADDEAYAGEGNGQEEEDAVFVSSEDMGRMGLDAWSEGDRRFVVEMVEFYWGRRCEVRGARVECCGVRIC